MFSLGNIFEIRILTTDKKIIQTWENFKIGYYFCISDDPSQKSTY